LWLWPGLDLPPGALPARYPVLSGVAKLDLQYLNADLAWVDSWPAAPLDPPLPQAVRVRIVLTSNEEIVRLFVLKS